jgi:hypothetical protein
LSLAGAKELIKLTLGNLGREWRYNRRDGLVEELFEVT